MYVMDLFCCTLCMNTCLLEFMFKGSPSTFYFILILLHVFYSSLKIIYIAKIATFLKHAFVWLSIYNHADSMIIWLIKSRRMRWVGHGACMGERTGAYRVLVGKFEWKRPLGRTRRRWENNIKMDLQEVGWGMDWIDLAQDRNTWQALINTVMNLQVP